MKYRLSIVIHDMKYKRKLCPLTSVVGQRLRRRKSSENPPRTTSRLTPATARLCRASHSTHSALALEVGFTSRLLSRCESLRLSFYRERGGGSNKPLRYLPRVARAHVSLMRSADLLELAHQLPIPLVDDCCSSFPSSPVIVDPAVVRRRRVSSLLSQQHPPPVLVESDMHTMRTPQALDQAVKIRPRAGMGLRENERRPRHRRIEQLAEEGVVGRPYQRCVLSDAVLDGVQPRIADKVEAIRIDRIVQGSRYVAPPPPDDEERRHCEQNDAASAIPT